MYVVLKYCESDTPLRKTLREESYRVIALTGREYFEFIVSGGINIRICDIKLFE
jgi:hypothetical protein